MTTCPDVTALFPSAKALPSKGAPRQRLVRLNLILAMMAALFAAVVALEVITG